MTAPRVIGFLGAMGAGKSTAALHLCEKHGFQRIRIADSIKNMMLLLGLDYEAVCGSRKEVPLDHLGGRTSRYAQQTLGTEWGRETISQDIWVLQLVRKVEDLARSGGVVKVVVDDVRFPNEAQVLRDRFGARLYTVRRSAAEFAPWRQWALRKLGWWAGGPLGIHESERGWVTIKPDGELYNESTEDGLCWLVDQMMRWNAL